MQRTQTDAALTSILDPDAGLEALAETFTANVAPRTLHEHIALSLRAQLGDLDAGECYDLEGAL